MVGSRRFESALVVAPHADDEVLGAGGLIARLVRDGASVHVVFGAVDGMAHYGVDHRTTVAEREKEIDAVASMLGYSYSILYRGQDLIEKLDTVPQRDLVNALEAALNCHRPDLFALPHGIDFDQDHVACFRAGFAAARPIPANLGKFFPSTVISYEMPKLTWSAQPFHPAAYLDISDVLQQKLDAITAYATQLRAPPHIRSLENITALARLRGSEVGLPFAEAFHVHRWVI